ncbi:phage protein NinX family protein [Pseudomonas violetae]|uniref:DUF2591 domain-containing protein n=1 Tax=Pseudomonas violetae TaxID=2915813 RepID=A0ABT0EU40_9PSED|nr:phage protein NinX family protein [Pseudomonas violetae]MCK1788934.1 DUF2591 domain-containing protein [Pseudomonas violetae]
MSTQTESFKSQLSDPAAFVRVDLNDLDGPGLDWAVAQAAGIPVQFDPDQHQHQHVTMVWQVYPHGLVPFRPSADWSDAGPLIRQFQMALTPESHYGAEGTEMSDRWIADIYYDGGDHYTTEPARDELVAACRAIAVTKFGDTLNVPAELARTCASN